MGRRPKSALKRNRISLFVCNRVGLEQLFSGHAFLESLNPLFGRLFNEGHVLGEMLLSIDLPFITPLLLIESELRDDRSVFFIELFPDLGTA